MVDLGDQISFSDRLLKQISLLLGCGQFDIVLKRSWGTECSLTSPTQHRLEIRAGLAKYLRAGARSPVFLAADWPPWLWEADLDLLPQMAGQEFSFSISHGRRHGGFAICRTSSVASQPTSLSEGPHAFAGSLGFDLETTDRLSASILARISSSEERLWVPDARLLWVAKEATFKACRGPAQPVVIADIIVQDWTIVGTIAGYTVYRFQVLGISGTGVVVSPLDQGNTEIFAFFYENSRPT